MLKLLKFVIIFNLVIVGIRNTNQVLALPNPRIVPENIGKLNNEEKHDESLPKPEDVPQEKASILRVSALLDSKDTPQENKDVNLIVPKTNVSSNQKDVNTIKENKNGTSTIITNNFPKMSKDMLQSGALLRGFYVFLALSMITMFYFVFRSYRLRHGNSEPSNTVRKYGVTARRSDMEMRPLELDEEDDDTLFEVNQPSGSNR